MPHWTDLFTFLWIGLLAFFDWYVYQHGMPPSVRHKNPSYGYAVLAVMHVAVIGDIFRIIGKTRNARGGGKLQQQLKLLLRAGEVATIGPVRGNGPCVIELECRQPKIDVIVTGKNTELFEGPLSAAIGYGSGKSAMHEIVLTMRDSVSWEIAFNISIAPDAREVINPRSFRLTHSQKVESAEMNLALEIRGRCVLLDKSAEVKVAPLASSAN